MGEWTLPSLISFGKIGKEKVVVFAHVPNYFSKDPQRIIDILDQKGSLIDGAGKLPQQEFERLCNLNDQGVFVVNYEKIGHGFLCSVPFEEILVSKYSSSSINNILDHPITIPFLGVTKDEAEAYLHMYRQKQEVIGRRSEVIIQYQHCDSFQESQPLGRFLCLGYTSIPSDLYGEYELFDARCHLKDSGRVLGERNITLYDLKKEKQQKQLEEKQKQLEEKLKQMEEGLKQMEEMERVRLRDMRDMRNMDNFRHYSRPKALTNEEIFGPRYRRREDDSDRSSHYGYGSGNEFFDGDD